MSNSHIQRQYLNWVCEKYCLIVCDLFEMFCHIHMTNTTIFYRKCIKSLDCKKKNNSAKCESKYDILIRVVAKVSHTFHS